MHDKLHDFTLSGREHDRLGGFLDGSVDQKLRFALAQVAAAGSDGAQRTKKLGVERVLAEVAVRARTQALTDILTLAVHREDEDAHGRLHRLEAAQAFDTAHARHGEV